MSELAGDQASDALSQRRARLVSGLVAGMVSEFLVFVVVAMHDSRPLGGDLASEDEHAGAEVDEEEQGDRSTERAVDGVVVGEVAKIDRESELEYLEEQRCDERAGNSVADAHGDAGHDREDDAEGEPGHQERQQPDEDGEDAAGLGTEGSELVGERLGHVASDLEDGRSADGDGDQDSDADDESEIDQFAAHEGPSKFEVPDAVESKAQGGHHAGGGPDQTEDGDDANGGASTGNRVDERLEVFAAGPGLQWQQIKDSVNRILADAVVGEQESDNGDQEDRERKDREEDVVGDRGGELWAVVVKELGDRPFAEQPEVSSPPAQVQRPPVSPTQESLAIDCYWRNRRAQPGWTRELGSSHGSIIRRIARCRLEHVVEQVVEQVGAE